MSFNTMIYDAAAALHDGTAITASANGSVASLNVGGNTRAALVVNITAIASGGAANETYDIKVLGATAVDGTGAFTGAYVELASIGIGDSASHGGSADEYPTGNLILPFVANKAGTNYPYVRVRVDTGGTAPSITAKMWVAKWD